MDKGEVSGRTIPIVYAIKIGAEPVVFENVIYGIKWTEFDTVRYPEGNREHWLEHYDPDMLNWTYGTCFHKKGEDRLALAKTGDYFVFVSACGKRYVLAIMQMFIGWSLKYLVQKKRLTEYPYQYNCHVRNYNLGNEAKEKGAKIFLGNRKKSVRMGTLVRFPYKLYKESVVRAFQWEDMEEYIRIWTG